MTKLELLRMGLLGLVSYPAVIRITVIIIILSTFLVFMSDSTFTIGNFLDNNKENGPFQNSITVNSVGTWE